MRRKANEAAEQVITWERLWKAFLEARASGDFARIEAARQAIEAFDRETGAQPLRCTRQKA